MNRKLINGLLLLTVATGGVGTFTSCKDNEEGFEIKKDQAKLFDILDEKIKQGDDNLEVVRTKLNALLEAGLLTTENQEYLEDLIKNNQNYAEQLKVYVDDMVMSLITSVEIQEVYNPAFGTLNLPLGIQSTLLCNYYYQGEDANIEFPLNPNQTYGEESAFDALVALEKKGVKVASESFGTKVADIDRLGEIYVTVNPSTVPADALEGLTIKLMKSNGEQVLGELKAVKEDDHVINFGYTRANNNGFYKISVKASAEQVPSIALHLDDALISTAKDFVKNPSKSDFAGLAEAIYKQFNNRIPALGLEFGVEVPTTFEYKTTPWNPTPGGLVIGTIDNNNGIYTPNDGDYTPGKKGEVTDVTSNPAEDKDGNVINPILRNVYTKYAIGAVTYRPLSYSFHPEDYIPNRRLPQVGHIQEYVSKILDKVSFQLDLEGLNPNDYSIDLSGVEFTVDPTSMEISLAGLPVYGVNPDGSTNKNDLVGRLGDDAKITLGYKQPADPSKGVEYQPEALNGLIDSIVKAVNGDGNDKSFVAQIQKEVDAQLQNIIADINKQLTSVNTQITDKIQSVKDEINNELNGRLGDGINRLIDLYNKVAEKVNSILDDPNAYMQIYAAYRDGNGDLHHFSTIASDPSIFTPGRGDAITMFLTSYNAELLAPAYKKYVAVVADLNDANADLASINATEGLNTILEGRQQRVYIPSSKLTPGHTYQIVYAALDYRGYESLRSFYIKVVK